MARCHVFPLALISAIVVVAGLAVPSSIASPGAPEVCLVAKTVIRAPQRSYARFVLKQTLARGARFKGVAHFPHHVEKSAVRANREGIGVLKFWVGKVAPGTHANVRMTVHKGTKVATCRRATIVVRRD